MDRTETEDTVAGQAASGVAEAPGQGWGFTRRSKSYMGCFQKKLIGTCCLLGHLASSDWQLVAVTEGHSPESDDRVSGLESQDIASRRAVEFPGPGQSCLSALPSLVLFSQESSKKMFLLVGLRPDIQDHHSRTMASA